MGASDKVFHRGADTTKASATTGVTEFQASALSQGPVMDEMDVLFGKAERVNGGVMEPTQVSRPLVTKPVKRNARTGEGWGQQSCDW